MDDNVLVIIAIALPFVFAIVIVWIKYKETSKRNQLQAELYAKFIEKGLPVPTDLFAQSAQPKRKINPLNTGIISGALGISISIFIVVVSNGSTESLRASALGIIPVMIGIAFLIIHFIGKKQKASENAQ